MCRIRIAGNGIRHPRQDRRRADPARPSRRFPGPAPRPFEDHGAGGGGRGLPATG
ncbi:hypothetical protein ACFPM0_10530 [Pseudonocardia sulfidoxydans]|uniref:hypothetical protein n=1 Tax=Pseudonocardia sulfidoxydans TaxID=54011 RepID=UPI00361C11E3